MGKAIYTRNLSRLYIHVYFPNTETVFKNCFSPNTRFGSFFLARTDSFGVELWEFQIYVCRYKSLSFRLPFDAPPIQHLFKCLIIPLIVHVCLQVYLCQPRLCFIRIPVLTYHVEKFSTPNICLLYCTEPKDNERYTQNNLLARGSVTYKQRKSRSQEQFWLF